MNMLKRSLSSVSLRCTVRRVSTASAAVDLSELPQPTFRPEDYIRACKQLNHTLDILKKEMGISKIQKPHAKALEDKISDEQRRYSLNEQLKVLKKELWLETDDKTAPSAELRERINFIKHKIPPHVLEVIEEEFQMLETSSSLFDGTCKYLDWVTAAPPWIDCRFEEVNVSNFKADEDWHPGLGYSEKITRRNGEIMPKKVEVIEAALLALIENYYRREACVQNLQEHIQKIESKIALWQKALQMFCKSNQLLAYQNGKSPSEKIDSPSGTCKSLCTSEITRLT